MTIFNFAAATSYSRPNQAKSTNSPMARKGRNAAMMRAFSILENCIGSMSGIHCNRRASSGTAIG